MICSDGYAACVQNEFFPRWDEVKAEHVKPGIKHIIADLEKELTALEANVQPTWKGLVEPLERISDRISRAWGTVSHLKVRLALPTACLVPSRNGIRFRPRFNENMPTTSNTYSHIQPRDVGAGNCNPSTSQLELVNSPPSHAAKHFAHSRHSRGTPNAC